VSYKIFASSSSWIEGEAVRQLEATLALPGMEYAVGLPDLHPGKGHPIGAAAIARGRVYPFLIGGDIGCGVSLWRLGVKAAKAKREAIAKRLARLEEAWDGDAAAWLARFGVAEPRWAGALGTIGGGNHFAELQTVEDVVREERFAALGLAAGELLLTVHSGSRGLGEEILRAHTAVHGAKGLAAESEAAARYLVEHDGAVRWGHANRALIAHRIAELIGAPRCEVVLDLCHNSVVPCAHGGHTCWLHRKGAAPADQGPLVIPGSRGAFSYLVEPRGDQAANAWSLAHGAGRKYSRSAMRDRLKGEVSAESLRRTKLGSVVVCASRDLLFEEAPEAYKKVETVIDDMRELIDVVARLRPFVTYKVGG
jgi:release factor H-coupled RctB family protein